MKVNKRKEQTSSYEKSPPPLKAEFFKKPGVPEFKPHPFSAILTPFCPEVLSRSIQISLKAIDFFFKKSKMLHSKFEDFK
ncbi:MAG: hypothetical protein KR126chlam3_01625 [Chlamydiae bacterium]|nr:hypothetical protein [Chlamydiota bacterium]